MTNAYGAVVIGADPNGLVAANHLADLDWSVLVLEAQSDTGGAVRSAEDVHPSFVHDTFSAFYALAAASPAIRSFGLDEQGLVWRRGPGRSGPSPARRRLGTDPPRPRRHGPADGGAAPGRRRGLAVPLSSVDHIGGQLIGALLSPFPSVRSGPGVLTRLRGVGGWSS